MSGFRISRRTLLRGAGGVAIALPWLEIMESERRVHAASTFAQRFVAVYNPGGTVLDEWRPTGTESAFTLSPILAPFASVQNRIIVVDGVDMKSAVGEQNQAGMVALLTGTPQASGTTLGYAQGPSIDQVIASRLAGGRALWSLSQAVRWGTGKSHGHVSPMNILNFENRDTFSPIQPELDPAKTWQDLFGAPPSAGSAWDKSVLDAVDRRYQKLAARLGTEDRTRLEQHLDGIRELERTLGALAGCAPPALVDTAPYNPLEGLNSADDGSVKNPETDAMIPAVGKFMADMLVMALACDLTAVGTLQWSDSEAKHTFPWLGLEETYAYYQSDGGYHPTECAQIGKWYMEQHAYLLEKMASVDMGGHSLLDESVVFCGSHIQNPPTHVKTDMPFLLAGNGGGLRTGRWVRYPSVSHNDLLVAILNLFGDPSITFGDPKYCDGPLGNLT